MARQSAGLANPDRSSKRAIAEELEHFRQCDFVTAPNAEVERALLALGLPETKIVSTSFGWARERFAVAPPSPAAAGQGDARKHRKFTVLFVGHLDARKGAHYLFDAWKDMPSAMRLQLVGTVDPEMAPLLKLALGDDTIAHLPFTADLGPIFRAADVFAFPTVEEGGPQVTFEAAGCGVPVVTTPMGAARIIVDGHNGLVIPPHDVAALRSAILRLFEHPKERAAYARQAGLDAQAFTYEKVGASRAMLFRSKFSEYLKACAVG